MNPAEADDPALVAVANYLRIVSHPSRLAIALLLLNGPSAVSDIESSLGLHQPNLSQHLGVLRDANILTASRQAKSVIYDLCDGPAKELIRAIAPSVRAAVAAPAVSEAPMPASVVTKSAASEPDDALMFAHVLVRGPAS